MWFSSSCMTVNSRDTDSTGILYKLSAGPLKPVGNVKPEKQNKCGG